MVLTNKFDVEYNLEQIDKDFDIFLIKNCQQYGKIQDYVLDKALLQYKARAIQYAWGGKAFVLFFKNTVSEEEYCEMVRETCPDYIVKKVNLFDKEDFSLFFYKQRLLAQLLINSLNIPKNSNYAYNNLTGKLYYSNPAWKYDDPKTHQPYMKYFLQISFNAGFYLNLDVKTFRLYNKYQTKAGYVIDPKTGNFRRVLPGDDTMDMPIFIEDGFDGKRITVKYLDFTNIDSFRKSKLGVLKQFLDDVEEQLGQYLKLSVGTREDDKNGEGIHSIELDYRELLKDRIINIEDTINNDASNIIIVRLLQELHLLYGAKTTLGQVREDALNIRLIHNKEYYETHSEAIDNHYSSNKIAIQHLALEDNFESFSSNDRGAANIVKKIVQELLIKDDICKNKISLFDWKSFAKGETWNFITAKKYFKESQEKGKKGQFYYIFYWLKVSKDGVLEYSSFSEMDPILTKEQKAICFGYHNKLEDLSGSEKLIDGLFYTDIDNINYIIETKEKTMPNIDKVYDCLDETNDKTKLETSMIIQYLDEFTMQFPKEREYSEGVKELLSENTYLTRKQVRKFINMKSSSGKRFNRFMYENYGLRISAEIKNKEFDEIYELKNVLDIRYFIDENTDGKGYKSFNYFVGPKRNSLQTSIHNACVIRQIHSEQGFDFNKFITLLSVDFVRVGMYTVLPFPYKYLREFDYRSGIGDE